MKIWVAIYDHGDSTAAWLTKPTDQWVEETILAGAEGKVLVDRQALAEALRGEVGLAESRYYRWPDCEYEEEPREPHPHSGTCPLREPES